MDQTKYGDTEREQATVKALLVIMRDPRSKAWLKANDPKAYEQASRALTAYGF